MHDVAIIGGGPGGYVAAIRAAQLGLDVILVEKEQIGGICLNWGCIPTKALLKSAELYYSIKSASAFGVNVSRANFDLRVAIDRSRNVVNKLTNGIGSLMKKNNIRVISGHGSIIDKTSISISDQSGTQVSKIDAKYIVIATGGSARILPGYEPDTNRIWSYKEAIIQKEIPESLIVVGSGAIGMEFASFYNMIGSKVTVLEAKSTILPTEDEEISKFAKKSFESHGITFHTDIKLEKLEKARNGITLSFTSPYNAHTIKASAILMAVGISPNSKNIGLEKSSIKTDREWILIDQFCTTNIDNIFAIGDVATTTPWLAHKASHEGIVVAEKIASLCNKYDSTKIHPLSKNNIPSCIYTYPQIASIGMTENEAISAGRRVRVGKFSAKGNGKSIAIADEDGMIKVIFDHETGELLGAHMIGHEVTEMIHSFAIARAGELTDIDFIHTIFPHPTVSEMIHESVLDSMKRVIHA